MSLRAWLYRIAHHEALAVIRRRGPATVALDVGAAALAAPSDAPARERLRELVSDIQEWLYASFRTSS